MSLYKTAVQRPVATFMAFIAILVLGIYSLVQLPIELFPEIDPPNISVFTSYPGAGALEVEQNVTEELENQLSAISDLDELNSTSIDNLSIINLQFTWEANIDEATNEVRDAIGRVRNLLPDDAEDPSIFKFSSTMFPVVILGVTADESFPNIRQILDDEVVSPLNRITGVGNVTLQGGPIREIHILFDPARLEAYNLDINRLSQILAAENVTVPAGDITVGKLEYNIRIDAELETLEDIRNIVVSNEGNQPVYLRNVAQVKDTVQEISRLERINGQQGVTVVIQKQTEANTVDVSRAVIDQLPGLRQRLPDDVNLEVIIDTSDFITSSINNLKNVLIYAIIFVALVVLFFLKRWRATLIVALTIPFSLVGAFIYLQITGNTLNLISLSSLSIALGMVVDDAIVVFENLMKHIERGSRPKEAAIYGTSEVGIAVIATTLTVIAVFYPLTFLSGMTGIWFGQLGYIVVVTISISTLAALSLIPMLSSVLLKRQKDDKPRKSGFFQKIKEKRHNASEKILVGLDNAYSKTLAWALKRKWLTIILSGIIFVASLFLIGGIGAEFMPERDAGQLSLTVELATGRSLETAEKTIRKIEDIFREHVPEMEVMTAGAGTNPASFGAASSGPNVIDVTARLTSVSERDRSVFEIADELRKQLNDVPEVIDFSVETQGGGQQQFPIAIDIVGNDLTRIKQIADTLASKLRSIEGTRDVDLSVEEERPELTIDFDRETLASFGLNAGSVAQSIRNRIEGATPSQFTEEGEEYDIRMQYSGEFRQSINDIRAITVLTPAGEKVRVEQLGKVGIIYSPPRIERVDRERSITVTSGLYQSSISEIMEEIQPFIAGMDLPPGISIEYGGEFEEQQEAFADLFMILGLSILLVYIVMAAQFESYKNPFVIMFSIPFAFTGVLISLYITNTNLSVISFLGGIILIGIVVKNGIVLIDYVNLLRGRGQSLYDAVMNSGKSRLRPVLMTTLTTVLAMFPLAVSGGEGAETWRPMAISVVGGLTFSTLITLVFVPALYMIIERKSDGKAGKKDLVS